MTRALLAAAALTLLVCGCEETPPPITLGVTAEEHAPYFPITADAPHALGAAAPDGTAISCDSCHDVAAATFKPSTGCFACHQADATPLGTVHGEIAGYEPFDAACFACHPDGNAGAENGVGSHSDLWFPIDPDDSHGNAAYLARVPAGQTTCTACHASVEDRTAALCVECHAADVTPLDTAHGSLPLANVFRNHDDNVSCKECHAETPISPVVRPVDAHTAATTLEADHEIADCYDCHTTKRTEPKEWAIDFKAAQCLPCHVTACSVANPGGC